MDSFTIVIAFCENIVTVIFHYCDTHIHTAHNQTYTTYSLLSWDRLDHWQTDLQHTETDRHTDRQTWIMTLRHTLTDTHTTLTQHSHTLTQHSHNTHTHSHILTQHSHNTHTTLTQHTHTHTHTHSHTLTQHSHYTHTFTQHSHNTHTTHTHSHTHTLTRTWLFMYMNYIPYRAYLSWDLNSSPRNLPDTSWHCQVCIDTLLSAICNTNTE